MSPAARRRTLALLAVSTAVTLGLTTGGPADAQDEPAAPAAGATAPAAASAAGTRGHLPTSANGVWAYDEAGPGTWSGVINAYNDAATPGHALTQVFSYATDMEMYCPDGDVTACRPQDLQSYYTPKGPGWQSTLRYHADLNLASGIGSGSNEPSVAIMPIIDGRVEEGGYLLGFNELSRSLAQTYADQVTAQVCADPRIDGIQFDVEPFDVSTRNGQYWFYLQVAKNFAGKNAGTSGPDPLGCVSADHPKGRYFSVFTFAKAIRPGTQSARNVGDIARAQGNFYVMDSLYDLGTGPAGQLNDLPTYRALVREEARSMKQWSRALGISYGFGIPASASLHEYSTCTGDGCAPGADGSTGHPMLAYTQRAVEAIEAVGAPADPRFLGTSIWDLGGSVAYDGNVVTPAPAPADVLHYLTTHLPG